MKAEFLADVRSMTFDGSRAYMKFVGNFGAGFPVGYKAQDPLFSRGEFYLFLL